MEDSNYTPLEQPVETITGQNNVTVGLPCCASSTERRFPLTPEAVQALTDAGFRVLIESGAGNTIHYTDNQYTRCGAIVAQRRETFGCDIVIHLAPVPLADTRQMKRGAMLLTFFNADPDNAPSLRELLRLGVTTLAIDHIEDTRGNTPFADILDEVDGRAALAIASSLLADAVHGKGILLGGVAGIVPCEVLIIGSGDTALAAASSAKGLGAVVRMMDNDAYSLRDAMRQEGQSIIASSIHPRGLAQALRTADVVVYTDIERPLIFDRDDVDTMKRGVITFDLSRSPGHAFPSMPTINLSDAAALDNSFTAGTRVCYVNAGSAVPRTAAMALSNIFLTLFAKIAECQGSLNALKALPGLQRGAMTFLGRAVNRKVALATGSRPSNISLFLALS